MNGMPNHPANWLSRRHALGNCYQSATDIILNRRLRGHCANAPRLAQCRHMGALPTLREMMAQLIATPSVSSTTPPLDMGNRAVVDLLAGWLNELGFMIEIQPLENLADKANLIATLGEGDQHDKGLTLSGHTDTVPYDEGRWRFNPFTLTEADNRLYGLGTADMKCFLALAVEAAREFKAADLRQPLRIVATADEESSMNGARQLAERGAPLGRYCVIGEPTGLLPVARHKGIFMETIRLQGRSGHSSDPRLGNSALEGMHAVIQALLDFRAELGRNHQDPSFDVPAPTLNLGRIQGGDNPNRICGDCVLQIDLRPLPGMVIEALRKELRRRVTEAAKQRELRCDFESLFEDIPALATPADSKIVRLCERLTGQPAGAVAFATEAPYFSEMGVETVIFGPGDVAQAHQPNEYLPAERIPPTIDLLRALIREVCT